MAFGFALSAAAGWTLGQAIDLRKVWQILSGARPELIAAAVLSLGSSMMLRTARWRSVLPPTRGPRPSTARLLPFVIIGYAANAIAPLRLGDPARAILSARRFGTGIPETLGSVGLERVIDALALALLLLVASIGAAVPGWFAQASSLIVMVTVVVLVGVYVTGSRVRVDPTRRAAVVMRIWRGARANPSEIARSLGWSLMAWCVDGVTFWLCAQALGFEISVGAALLIAGGAALGSVLPSAPAALGTYELSGTAVAVALGVTPTDGLALVLLGHATTVVPIVIAGVIVTAALGVNIRHLGRLSTAPVSATEGAP